MAEENPRKLYNVSTSPHIRHTDSVPGIMMWVCIALMPALGISVYFFGMRALGITAVSVLGAVGTEWAVTRFMGKARSIGDYSAIVTGMLVAFNVPPEIPWWMPLLGSAFAIGVAKMPFGGLGHNWINPALAGRAFLMASYPAEMTSFSQKYVLHGVISGIDGVTAATPLQHIKAAMAAGSFQALDFQEAISSLIFGNVGGCIGETSAVALLLGAMILWYKRILGFKIPVFYIGTVFILFWLFNGTGGLFTSDAFIVPIYHVFAGGLMLGALFMATDMVTSPVSPGGKILFGTGCGILTFLIRKYGGYPEGVSYSILLMNCVAPLLDRYTRPRKYGEKKKSA